MHSLAPVLLGYKEQIILKPKKEIDKSFSFNAWA